MIYGPRAQVKYAGSSGFTLSGSIIAYSPSLSGSGWNITAGGSPAPGDKTILLEQSGSALATGRPWDGGC